MVRAFPSKLIHLPPKVQSMSPLRGICEQHSARIARASGSQSEHYCWSLTCTSSPLAGCIKLFHFYCEKPLWGKKKFTDLQTIVTGKKHILLLQEYMSYSGHELERNGEPGSVFSMGLIKPEPQVWDARNAQSLQKASDAFSNGRTQAEEESREGWLLWGFLKVLARS